MVDNTRPRTTKRGIPLVNPRRLPRDPLSVPNRMIQLYLTVFLEWVDLARKARQDRGHFSAARLPARWSVFLREILMIHRTRRPAPPPRLASTILVALGLALSSPVPSTAQDGLPLREGSVLTVVGFGAPHTLIEFSASGEELGRLGIQDPAGLITSPSGLTLSGDVLWVSGSNTVNRIDLKSGLASPGFQITEQISLTALADDGEFLLVGDIHPDRVLRFDSSGQLQDTIVLDPEVLMTGLDTDGSRLFVTSYQTGHVHVFDLDGHQIEVIPTDLGAGTLTGASLDKDGRSLWVTTGTGINDILHFDLAGQPLGSFRVTAQATQGLHVVGLPVFVDGFESGNTDSWTLTTP